MEIGDLISEDSALRQGDVIRLPHPQTHTARYAPNLAMIVSQTCDVVQTGPSKLNITLAPVLKDPTNQEISDSRTGRSPLLIQVPTKRTEGPDVADLQGVWSTPKKKICGGSLVGRISVGDSDSSARSLATRIGRAYSRFAFPDEVVPVFRNLRDKAMKTVGKPSPLGQVLNQVSDLRVGADQWENPRRNLTLYIIVPSNLLIDASTADPAWTPSPLTIDRLKPSQSLKDLSVTRLSELILRALPGQNSQDTEFNPTTLLRLWEAWAEVLFAQLVEPYCGEEVAAVELELLNEEEFTYAQLRQTESLDLEALSL